MAHEFWSIRDWLDDFTGETGEPVDVLRVRFDRDGRAAGWWPEGWPRFPEGRALPVDTFGAALDVRFDCQSWGRNVEVMLWSESWVGFTAELSSHDVYLVWLPRHPIDVTSRESVPTKAPIARD